MTIRRDLDELDKAGKIVRIHGGAQSMSYSINQELSHSEKQELQIEEKRKIKFGHFADINTKTYIESNKRKTNLSYL